MNEEDFQKILIENSNLRTKLSKQRTKYSKMRTNLAIGGFIISIVAIVIAVLL